MLTVRTRRSVAFFGIVALLTGGCTVPPHARSPLASPLASSWANLDGIEGASVEVLLDDGRIVKGRAGRPTDRALAVTVTTHGVVTSPVLPRDTVVRVVAVRSESGERAKSGALVGLGMGALATLLVGPGLWFTLLEDPAFFAGLGALSGLPIKHEVVMFDRR